MTKDSLLEKLEEFVITEYENEKAPKTIQSYKQEVTFFINWLPETYELNKNLLIDFKKYLQSKYKPNTQNHYIVIVNKFLYFCGFEGLKLTKVRIQNKTSLNDQIEQQEHNRLLRWAKKLNQIDMYYIMRLFGESGIRVVEIKFFTVESLDWRIEVFNKDKYREVIIPSNLVRELKKYCKEKKIKSGYIFPAPKDNNKPIPPNTVWYRLKQLAKKAKINPNKIHPHAWRHLFAIKAKEAGMDLDELRDVMGHNNINTTAIYTRTSSKDKRKKLENIKYYTKHK